jgi:hypothetical protein
LPGRHDVIDRRKRAVRPRHPPAALPHARQTPAASLPRESGGGR